MNIALMLHRGIRAGAPSETTSHSHIELLASNAAERQKLKVLADQLKAFGAIPFAYHEMESLDHAQQGAALRIALAERPEEPAPPSDAQRTTDH